MAFLPLQYFLLPHKLVLRDLRIVFHPLIGKVGSWELRLKFSTDRVVNILKFFTALYALGITYIVSIEGLN